MWLFILDLNLPSCYLSPISSVFSSSTDFFWFTWVFFIIWFWFIYYISEHISSYTFFSHCSTYYSVQCLCDLTQFTCVDGLPCQVKIEILPPFFVVVVQLFSCVRLWDPVDCSTPGLPPLHHQLLEFTQTHVHW